MHWSFCPVCEQFFPRQTHFASDYDPNPQYTTLHELPEESQNPVYAASHLLKCIGIEDFDPRPQLAPSLLARYKASKWLPEGRWIALGIGAFFDFRKWPIENFRTILEKLAGDGYRLVMVGSVDDVAASQAILQDGHPAAISLAGATNLDELAGVLSCCSLFIGNDSGPKHIAAAVGTAVVEIGCYSPHTPGFSYDRNFEAVGVPTIRLMPEGFFSQEETFSGHAIASVSVNSVLHAADKLLNVDKCSRGDSSVPSN